MPFEARSRAAPVRSASVGTGLGPRTGPEKATDRGDGSGYTDRPPGFLASPGILGFPLIIIVSLVAGLVLGGL